jgi:glycosyltransferase involved in cell wall biosynthesis
MPAPKIAIVCEFLTVMGGAENVVLELHNMFPDAPIYTALYNPDKVPAFNGADIRPSYLQKLPTFFRKSYRLFPTIAVNAFKKMDLNDFDIIITSAYLNANQVQKTRPNQKIISYCHTPARYYWSHYDLYRKQPGFGALNPIIKLIYPAFVKKQRKLDYAAAQNVDVFIANSTETQRRIKQYYDKPSTVIYPPVAVDRFNPARTRSDFYVTLGRQLPNKRFDLAVAACKQLSVPLKVFGNGPMHNELLQLAAGGKNISFYTDRFGDASDAAVELALNQAKGFIFPSDEDFGIVSVEALAAGAPVIGFASAGTKDIVQDGESGVLFAHQTVADAVQAIQQANQITFLPGTLRRKAKRFDKSLFITKMRKIVQDNANL